MAINKRTVLIAAAAALAAGGGGAAIAATQLDSPSARSDAIVSDAAKQLGIEPEALSAALKTAEKRQVDADVAAGRLTKEQGDRLKAAIEAGNVPLVGFGLALRLGHHGGVLIAELDTAAAYLGVSEAELRQMLRDGKSLAEVATARGKSVDGLVSALVDTAKKQLDAAATAGRITPERKQALEADLEQRITELVNGKLPAFSAHGLRGGPGFGLGLLGLARSTLESATTEYLGLTEAQLESDLRSGKTLAQIAAARGKSATGLVSALVNAAKKQLDAQVAAGRLTRSQADELEATLEERVGDLVDSSLPVPRFGFRRFGGPAFLPSAPRARS
jgi:hypothetical protein